ncbi:exopolyphosphatase, partial [Reticulomyxa filosa]
LSNKCMFLFVFLNKKLFQFVIVFIGFKSQKCLIKNKKEKKKIFENEKMTMRKKKDDNEKKEKKDKKKKDGDVNEEKKKDKVNVELEFLLNLVMKLLFVSGKAQLHLLRAWANLPYRAPMKNAKGLCKCLAMATQSIRTIICLQRRRTNAMRITLGGIKDCVEM